MNSLVKTIAHAEAKYRCPRNLGMSKEFAGAFRPSLHLVGAVVHGVAEFYFICQPDIPKGASTNLTILCKILSFPLHCEKILASNLCHVCAEPLCQVSHTHCHCLSLRPRPGAHEEAAGFQGPAATRKHRFPNR